MDEVGCRTKTTRSNIQARTRILGPIFSWAQATFVGVSAAWPERPCLVFGESIAGVNLFFFLC